MALNNRVETTTVEKIMPLVIDTILDENTFATLVLSKAKKFKSGRMKFPIKFSKGIAGTSFSGFDTLPTSASDTRVNMEYESKFYGLNVALPLTELSQNATEGKVIDLASLEMKSRAQDMADDIGDLFYGDGTGNSGKDFLGLEAIVDDGTNAPTIGGLSRTTYPTLNSTVTSTATLTLASMATLYNAITDGSVAPTHIMTTKTIWSFYEQLLQPQERIFKDVQLFPQGIKAGTGATALDYKGMPVMHDRKCPTGIMYFLNTKYLDFYGQPVFGTTKTSVKGKMIEGNDYSNAPDMGFSWGGWIKANNAASLNGFMYLGGELISANPKRHGKLTDITGV